MDVHDKIATSEIVPWRENSGKQGENEDEEQEEEPEELAAIKEELSHMPFEELQKLKERLGSKLYKKALHGKAKKKENGKKKFKRENKNRPMEMSAKKPVGRFREIVSVKKKINRDPRFDDLSGEYSQTIFHQTYSFLDDLKSREKNSVCSWLGTLCYLKIQEPKKLQMADFKIF
ncbi:ribosomal RNA processing protein 36 homolog [Lingula anatina]|uniref:rRNA biogenesis protein RRP36 n=1 Tax=Lingula anatina TaxID=7574 RepID=A0A1S3JY72_LINAN|nr:ribosomal RNA processing protein 36 homolog [Lingula anatina]|eukprot:XP_013415257.1 ribosomal RNA processing protein 36 homolog [Lingula anatina]